MTKTSKLDQASLVTGRCPKVLDGHSSYIRQYYGRTCPWVYPLVPLFYPLVPKKKIFQAFKLLKRKKDPSTPYASFTKSVEGRLVKPYQPWTKLTFSKEWVSAVGGYKCATTLSGLFFIKRYLILLNLYVIIC